MFDTNNSEQCVLITNIFRLHIHLFKRVLELIHMFGVFFPLKAWGGGIHLLQHPVSMFYIASLIFVQKL